VKHGKAEDAPPRREVGAERVGGADHGVGRNEAEGSLGRVVMWARFDSVHADGADRGAGDRSEHEGDGSHCLAKRRAAPHEPLAAEHGRKDERRNEASGVVEANRALELVPREEVESRLRQRGDKSERCEERDGCHRHEQLGEIAGIASGEEIDNTGVPVAGSKRRFTAVEVGDHDRDGHDRGSQSESRDHESLETPSPA
jgi:hypothetical protein